MNVDFPSRNNMQVLPEPQKKPKFDTEIDHGPELSRKLHEYLYVANTTVKPSHQK